ncbi:MAG: 2-oxo acid dehydrogenase subunit, partial [Propionibacteriaceae bacterium]|nr:2-oxo acid dehydrogenase subunit [Propionibacteriaceae bacterium]
MVEHVIKLPDVGEGVAEAELVEWHVKVGDLVREDTILGAVMTDKATVEIPSPVEGEVVWLGAEVGNVVAVGSDLVRLKVAGDDKGSVARDTSARAPAAGTVQPSVPATPPVGDAVARVPLATALPSPSANRSAQAAPPRHFVRGGARPAGEKPL